MRPTAVLAAFALLAGCVSPTPGADDPPAVDAPASTALAPLDLAGTGCKEGGGHSVHPKWPGYLPEPWEQADVLADVGPQLVYSEQPDPTSPVPSEGRTMGNYHATVVCDAWTFRGETKDMFLGFVGMKVERPAFDVGGDAPTHHYLVTVVATDDDDVLAALQAGGLPAMEATHAWETLADGTLRIRMWTESNGDYDSIFRAKPFGDLQATHVRLWMLASADGHAHHDDGAHGHVVEGEFRPVALDLFAEGGTHLVADGQGYFSHSGTAHHEPLPGASGHTAAILYDGFDRTVAWGPRPDVVLDAAYSH